ncbi:ricin B lectin domain-containing protein [Irpex rosettiformis]|uniref:Ricin B lectin domain-containing protein n=1 Tax=Irpex rosettiformis TaxID=378272 RepID=A0ACB8U8I4_9APHY|nr:ricin B lectin domain-containing protein [Irpex rosettiformis]
MAAAVIESGIYMIQNTGTNTVLELTGGSATDGTKLWVISQVGTDPLYTIENANSRTYADLTDGSAASGTPVIGSKGTGNPTQHWAFIQNADKTAYVIKNKSTGTYIDLFKGGYENGTPVNGWTVRYEKYGSLLFFT